MGVAVGVAVGAAMGGSDGGRQSSRRAAPRAPPPSLRRARARLLRLLWWRAWWLWAARHSQGKGPVQSPVGAQPLPPRVLELAASKVADSTGAEPADGD